VLIGYGSSTLLLTGVLAADVNPSQFTFD